MNSMLGVIGSLAIVIVTGLWALLKRKLNKALSKVEESEQRARKAETGQEIKQTEIKTKDEIVSGQKELQKQKESVDAKIEESSQKEEPDDKRKEQQEIVDGITDLFNARNTAR